MLEAYFNEVEPFTVDLGDSRIVLKTLNHLSFSEVHRLMSDTDFISSYGNLLRGLLIEDKDNFLRELTTNEQKQIWEELESQSGIELKYVKFLFDTIEKYPQELQQDLSKHTNVQNISELLKMKMIDGVNVFMAILKFSARKSWVYSEYNGYQMPFDPEFNIEAYLYQIAHFTGNSPWREVKLETPSPILKENTFNALLEPDPESGVTREMIDELLRIGVETGQFPDLRNMVVKD